MSETSSSSGGIGFFGLLGVVFITLKLIGYITWSWWWVTAPLWAPATLVLLTLLIGYLVFLLIKTMGKRNSRK